MKDNENKFSKENVGVILNALRVEQKLGQDDVAKALNISQGTVSKIEHGNLELSLSLYYDFLKLFKLDTEAFNSLIDRYVRVTLRAQRANVNPKVIKNLFQKEVIHEIKNVRSC